MPRATFEALIAQVRAQIAVDDDTAWNWLLDRARVLNAESSWLLVEEVADPSGDPDGRYYEIADDTVWIEAVIVNGQPYQRSTLHAMDARWGGSSGNAAGIYALGSTLRSPGGLFQIHPPTASAVTVRHVLDVVDDRTTAPPFPTDFDQALVDGTIAVGLARMDERFDSAAYFDAKFAGAIERLRRRRHAIVGRGATAIRVIQ